MDWQSGRRSDNVEDRRSVRGPVAIGGGAVVVLMIVGALFGIDPRDTLQAITNGQDDSAQTQPQAQTGGKPDEASDFVSAVLASTEDAWTQIFAAQHRSYSDPKLVLFRDRVSTACGGASAAVGPFYCPNDRKVYLDLSFFDELHRRFGAPGDFAQAYVIAHELGHHVQHLLGTDQEVRRAQQGDPSTANEYSVRLELQADCFAGVWGRSAQESNKLDPGDIEEGLNAAASVGDDRILQKAGRRVNTDSFTHGSAAQRTSWFKKGYDTGDPRACNTFAAR